MATAISNTYGSAPTYQTGSSNQPASLTQGAGGALGKDQFLQLLVAQMKNQDPLNPMDGTQMAAQLAQFSSVEQLQQINTTLASQGTGQTGLQQLLAENGALAAVGKNVVASAAAVDTTNGAPKEIQADIPTGATSATLHIYDAKGTEVASQALGSVSAGRQKFTLSGSAASVTGGVYTYAVETTDSTGTKATASTYVAGRVDGVRYTAQGPVITVGGAAVPYMSVTEITG